MSAILEGTPDKRLVLVTGRAYPELAEKVAECLGTEILETTSYDFANGEMYVRFTEPVRGADVFVLQCHSGDINKWIMEQLIMIDALKRASAKSITVVAPFLGYSRQDKKHRGREPITARLIFDLFHAAGADRIMTVDLHAAQEQGFFDGPVDHLTAMPVLLDYVRSTLDLGNTTIVSPDAGRIKVSEQWAAKLGNLPLAFIHKQRDITRPNHAEAHGIIGDVDGRDCVVIDDQPAQEYVKANPSLTILDTEFAVEDYAIAVAKGNTVMLEKVNQALSELIADGSVQKVIDKYITAD